MWQIGLPDDDRSEKPTDVDNIPKPQTMISTFQVRFAFCSFNYQQFLYFGKMDVCLRFVLPICKCIIHNTGGSYIHIYIKIYQYVPP